MKIPEANGIASKMRRAQHTPQPTSRVWCVFAVGGSTREARSYVSEGTFCVERAPPGPLCGHRFHRHPPHTSSLGGPVLLALRGRRAWLTLPASMRTIDGCSWPDTVSGGRLRGLGGASGWQARAWVASAAAARSPALRRSPARLAALFVPHSSFLPTPQPPPQGLLLAEGCPARLCPAR